MFIVGVVIDSSAGVSVCSGYNDGGNDSIEQEMWTFILHRLSLLSPSFSLLYSTVNECEKNVRYSFSRPSL